MKPLAPNTVLQNRYKIVNLIGKGGMGEVYLAVDQRLGSAIALKRTTVGDDPMLADAFEREAKTLANLRHSVLPKVSDHFSENDEQYLVMDHISGDDLSQRLKETKKPFPLNWVMFWADQLLEALTYLHTNEPPIIHRDIKPQNLKLTDENQIVLLDFGLSKNALGQTRVTTSGSVVGYTPHYAPMEQIRGSGTSARSDIYSLSATLYQILTNTVPPDALTRADGLLANLPDPIKPIYEINSEVPKSISDIIMDGMEISQEKRPANARDMQKALRRAFNKRQDSMSAQTVAFNVEEDKIPGSISEKTEVMTDLPPLPVGEIKSEIPSDPVVSGVSEPENDLVNTSSTEKTEVYDASQIPDLNSLDNLDATVQYDEPEVPVSRDAIEEDEAGLITEVIPGGLSSFESENTPVDKFSTKDDLSSSVPAPIPVADEFRTNDDVEMESESKDFSTSDGFSSESGQENVSPDATVPLISFDENSQSDSPESSSNETNDFSSFDSTSESDSVSETSGGTENFALTENFVASSDQVSGESFDQTEVFEANQNDSSAEVQKAVPPPVKTKSSTGKYVAILGGLGLILFVFLGSVLGIGWYMYGPNSGTVNNPETNNPTPQPSVEMTPEMEATPEVEPTPDLVETNTDPENTETETNSETEVTSTETNSESEPETKPNQNKKTKVTKTTTKPPTTPVRRTKTKTKTRPPNKKPKTGTTAKTKVTPKPKKKPKGKRTDIVQ